MLRNTLLAFALASPCAALAADVQPGRWELVMTTQVQGAQAPVDPVSQTRCISAADAQDPGRVLGTGVGCEFANRRDSGGAYSFEVTCSGPIPMSGSGSMRYSAQSLEGDLELGAELGGGQRLSMRSHVSGRRLGPCKQ